MTEEMKKKLAQNWSTIVCGVILVVFIILSFPIIRFDGNWIVLFSPTRPATIDRFDGWMLGSHVLETEHGEIKLRRFSEIRAINNRLARIDIREFEAGRASHNLVVYGMEMPPNISLTFTAAPVRISLLVLDYQEIIISGIPSRVWHFNLEPRRSDADIVIDILAPEYIVLADTTQIHFVPSLIGHQFMRGLSMYKKREIWMIDGRIAVRHPGKEEFIEYRSITFRPDWGEFIEGELFE